MVGGGWLRISLIIRLSQPSLAGVGAGAELGNKLTFLAFSHANMPVLCLPKDIYFNFDLFQ